MLKTETKTIVICDSCGKEFKDFNSNTCSHKMLYVKYSIELGRSCEIREICKDCNDKFIDFLKSNGMLDHAQIIY
jgi:hypothetical protein